MESVAAELLKKHAQAMGLSIRAVGKIIGLSPGHINRIANGHEPVPLRLIHEFADLFGLWHEARDEWIMEVRLSHCPPEIASEYRAMRERLSRTPDSTDQG